MVIVGDDDERILHRPKNTVIALSSDEGLRPHLSTLLV